MLTSPITVTIDGVAHQLSRINQDNFSAVYLKKLANREIRLSIRHSYEKANALGQYERHNVDLQDTTWDVDGNPVTAQTYTVMRVKRGQPIADVTVVNAGLATFVGANAAAIVGWES